MFNHPAGGPAAAAATGGWGWGAGTPAGKSGGKGGTGEGHGQLASPTRATRGAQLEWQWGNQGGTAGVSRIAAAARGWRRFAKKAAQAPVSIKQYGMFNILPLPSAG